METSVLVEKLEKLPDSLKKEVDNFVDFLIFKNKSQDEQLVEKTTFDKLNNQKKESFADSNLNESQVIYSEKSKLKREFGGMKGFVTYMAEDFDAPLEDFKDYM